MKNKIGIIGSGIVARTLGTGFLRHGYEVTIGTRDAGKLAEWHKGDGAKATVGSFADAARNADIIVLAVAGRVAESALDMAGLPVLDGKIVIDVTNPIAEAPPINGVLQFFTGPNDSLMERLQQKYPTVHFVKAFSCVGSALMVNPHLKGGAPSMFICGNDDNAKDEVRFILDQFGWETEDMGAVEAARAIEPLCILWCIPGFRHNQWMHAYKVLKV
jgi:8-hydroxy-5-deazaflavin:NADPH oxidoreductase